MTLSRPFTLKWDMDVELIDSMGSDASIVAAAKVSTQGIESRAAFEEEASAGLINFLMKHRHGSPFEHTTLTYFVRAPIFVFREFQRHRINSYNEESGRYKKLDPVFYVPDGNRNLVQEGKPGAYTFVPGTQELLKRQVFRMADAYTAAYTAYEEALAEGVAKEVARMVLPVAIYSSMYVTCNARALMHFLSLRTKRENSMFPSFPMREIEMVADEMERTFQQLFPITWRTFCENGRVSP